MLDQCGQPDGGIAEQLGAHHGVEEVRERKAAVALEDEEIVLGRVEEDADPGRCEDRSQGRELRGSAQGQGIDEPCVIARGDLNQAGLVEVVVEAVRLGVEGDHVLLQQVLGQRFEVLRPGDDVELGHARFCSLAHLCPLPEATRAGFDRLWGAVQEFLSKFAVRGS
jgi:hypothetical protein